MSTGQALHYQRQLEEATKKRKKALIAVLTLGLSQTPLVLYITNWKEAENERRKMSFGHTPIGGLFKILLFLIMSLIPLVLIWIVNIFMFFVHAEHCHGLKRKIAHEYSDDFEYNIDTSTSNPIKGKKNSNSSHGGCGIVIVLLLIVAAVAGGFYYYQQRQNTMTASSWFEEDWSSDENVVADELPTPTDVDEVSGATSTDVDVSSGATSADDEIYYYNVDASPVFPGAGEGLYQFIHDNLVYPQTAIDNNVTGTVHVTFVIEKNGQITNAEIVHDIGGGCGEEALRLVNSMPPWTPAYVNGEPVRYQFNLYVPF